MTAITINRSYSYPDTVAVVERDETGRIIWCNHDQGTDWGDVVTPEFDQDTKQYIMIDTERVETCSKCHAIFNNSLEEWEEVPGW